MNSRQGLLIGLVAVVLAAVFLSARSEFKVTRNSTSLFPFQALFPTEKPFPSPVSGRLKNPPEVIKAIYLTSWTAGTPSRLDEAIRLIKSTELNAAVIDVKDFSGKVAFETESPLIKKIGSEEKRIADFPGLVARLHQDGIYVVVRIAMFQDQHLVKVRPDLAVKDARTGQPWRDRKGLGWVDPTNREVWDYNVEVAKEASRAGVDELNFDYIRFPSDGSLENIVYPYWKEASSSRRDTIKKFFEYLTKNLKSTGAKLSVDVFGLATINKDDLGIGQVLEDALPYFDFVSPMVYPSHYASGFLQYKNPAAYPYEVVRYSLENAVTRRAKFAELFATSTREVISEELKDSLKPPEKIAQIRPWLQAFDLGAPYPPEVIRREIQAVYDVGLSHGWYLWNPSNVYNATALLKE